MEGRRPYSLPSSQESGNSGPSAEVIARIHNALVYRARAGRLALVGALGAIALILSVALNLLLVRGFRNIPFSPDDQTLGVGLTGLVGGMVVATAANRLFSRNNARQVSEIVKIARETGPE